MRNNYGCDLDSLGTGSRIGMMRTARGDLRYFINGADQGVACSGLPPGMGTSGTVGGMGGYRGGGDMGGDGGIKGRWGHGG